MINRIKTSGVVRESADILSTRIRMDSLCVCLFVWLNRTVSLPVARYLVYYCVTSFFIVSSNDATHREEDRLRRPSSGLPPNSLNRTLIAPRVLADIKTARRSRCPFFHSVSSRQTNRTQSKCDRESTSASPPEPRRRRKYYRVVLQVIQTSTIARWELYSEPDGDPDDLSKIRRSTCAARSACSLFSNVTSESSILFPDRNNSRIKSHEAPDSSKFAKRRRSTHQSSAPPRSSCSPFRDRVLHRSPSWFYVLEIVCVFMYVCVCACVCVRMCVPHDVSPSWCGASLLRPCPVYFLRPRYSTISCNLSFSSSSSSAWMQLVKYCVLKQSCLRRDKNRKQKDRLIHW